MKIKLRCLKFLENMVSEPPKKEEWQMTREVFIKYHKTAALPEETYEERTVKDFEWLGKKREVPEIYTDI